MDLELSTTTSIPFTKHFHQILYALYVIFS